MNKNRLRFGSDKRRTANEKHAGDNQQAGQCVYKRRLFLREDDGDQRRKDGLQVDVKTHHRGTQVFQPVRIEQVGQEGGEYDDVYD